LLWGYHAALTKRPGRIGGAFCAVLAIDRVVGIRPYAEIFISGRQTLFSSQGPFIAKGLIQIGDQIVGVFNADRHANNVRPCACSDFMFVRQLGVGGRGGVDNQATCGADKGQREET
jgi:hypothetical protein